MRRQTGFRKCPECDVFGRPLYGALFCACRRNLRGRVIQGWCECGERMLATPTGYVCNGGCGRIVPLARVVKHLDLVQVDVVRRLMVLKSEWTAGRSDRRRRCRITAC
jgi:hypothetical protein